MAKTTQEKNLTKIGKEPVVIFPLKKWEKIKASLDELEDVIRFYRAISDPENQEKIPFEEVKKKLNLP